MYQAKQAQSIKFLTSTCAVRSFAGTQITLTEYFFGFSQSLQKNAGIVTELAHKCFVSFDFAVHCSSVTLLFDAIPWAGIPA